MYGSLPPLTPEAQRFVQYLQQKQVVWAVAQRQETGFGGLDQELAAAYVIRTTAPVLAKEFEADREFWDHKICDFINNTRDEDIASLTTSLVGVVVSSFVVDAATVTIEALKIACSSKKGTNWAVPILGLGLLAILVGIAFMGGKKKN